MKGCIGDTFKHSENSSLPYMTYTNSSKQLNMGGLL